MLSRQLQGAPCCGITRGLYRDCSGDDHEVSFSIKLTPSDFCVNEVSIKGVVADVSAAPPCDEIELPVVSIDPELGAGEPEPIAQDNDSVLSSLSCADAPVTAAEPSRSSASLASPAECSLDTLRSCFADYSQWSRAHSDLSAIAPTFFSNAKPHGLFAPVLMLLSDAACADKLLRKRAYNIVRAMFPFVTLTTPSPPGTHCRLALDPFICDFPAFFDAADCAALCNFLNTSLPDGSSAFERDGSAADAVGVAVAVGKMQQWPRVHEFIHTRARFLMAENVTKSSDAATEPHVFVSRAPSRKRKRSPSRPITFTEFVLKKVNLGSEEAISQVASACGVSRHNFSRFGTKDKAAVTQQFVVARDLDAALIAQRCKRLQDIFVGCFRRVGQPALLGDSLGNQFRITLRRCHPSASAVHERLLRCGNGQFINYFGVQRVGDTACMLQRCDATGAWACVDLADLESVVASRGSKKTEWEAVMEGSQMMLAGWCAVQHQWAGFAACVLARSGRSGSLGHAMRDFCVMGDARALLKQLDKGRQPQHAVASVLARKGWTDAAAATSEVDRSYIVLAVNTLQSVLFNRLAAHRVSLGLEVLPDDLVRLPNGSVGSVSTDTLRYSLADVVLPLVGTKTLLPGYATSLFTSSLHAAAVAALASPPTQSDVNVSSATKKYIAQTGSYRRVVERARAFECALQGDGEDDGVVVQFELPAGCYATSFLFEMCAGGAP